MPDPEAPGIPADPRQWRPQTVRRVRVSPKITNPLVEPLWSGIRVIAHYRENEAPDEWGTIEVLDEYGLDVTDVAPIALDFLRRSVLASEAVIDGIITTQTATGGEGLGIVLSGAMNPMEQLMIGSRHDKGVAAEPPRNPREGVPGFVAVDLLSIDDQPLFDVPLLERKRILDGAIKESDLVRISPVVRPPLRQWFASWQAAGFRGLMIKAANSRYTPGVDTIEWATVERMPSS
jgi:ATP-dependent DNA ligase